MKQYYFNKEVKKWQSYCDEKLIGNYKTGVEAHDALFKYIKTMKETK